MITCLSTPEVWRRRGLRRPECTDRGAGRGCCVGDDIQINYRRSPCFRSSSNKAFIKSNTANKPHSVQEERGYEQDRRDEGPVCGICLGFRGEIRDGEQDVKEDPSSEEGACEKGVVSKLGV